MMAQFIYVADPMCSWCWAFRSVTEKLKERHPDLKWQYIMGGLAPDSDLPMPEKMQQGIQSIWHQIEETTGTQFNYEFWSQNTPRRSTYPSCRAVITAEEIAPGSADKMITAIQKAYYLNAQNPSDLSTLTALAESLDIDSTLFSEQIRSAEVEQKLQQHLNFAQQLGAQGFPSLYLRINEQVVPLALGYTQINKIEERLENILEGIS
ncbi:DsbA family protein [Neptuniibacter sp.]|uniref:DsbA family protein n=1 Tax=Neptuniibacter sp. TaxID=1962643 RepID=UPI00263396D0|nr:DsbA family protein [Neptuniibacter sp.]MCP4598409.1 DsbA family protein [Neptuniibacter sp.]